MQLKDPTSSQNAFLFDKILILYASQTGQAESISEYIYSQFLSGTLKSILEGFKDNQNSCVVRICSSKFEEHSNFFESHSSSCSHLLITVASTTGQGDPPDTALKFYRFLKKLQRSSKTNKSLPFSHIQFALLGLGDTNYDNFAQFSKNLNKVFQELGAQTFIDTKYADDAGELETVTEPFVEDLTTTLINLYSSASKNFSQKTEPTIMDSLFDSNEKISLNEKDLVSSLNSLQVSETKDDKISISEHDNENNKLIQSLLGPFTPGDESDYRKIPSQQASNFEEKWTILENNHASLLDYFQNRHNDTIIYDGFAKIIPGKVLKESSLSSSIHDKKINFKVEISFNMTSEQINKERSFIPGDSYGIYCMNSISDILTLCKHATLKINQEKNQSNEKEITLLEAFTSSEVELSKIGVKHQNECYELFSYLSYCVDTRTLIKRRDLYNLSKCAKIPAEALCLKEISTRKTNKLYDTVILPNFVTVCDILRLFPSIRINAYSLIAILNPAKARYFSLSNYPVIDKEKGIQKGKIWLSLTNGFLPFEGRIDENILGHFSGKFFLKNIVSTNESIFEYFQTKILPISHLNNSLEANLSSSLPLHRVPIFVFLRPNTFNISLDFNRPSLFFSAGTGLSPFLSFFKMRKSHFENDKSSEQNSANVIHFHSARNDELIIEKSTLIKCFKENKEGKNEGKNDLLFLVLSRQKAGVLLNETLKRYPITYGRISESLQQNSKTVQEIIELAHSQGNNLKINLNNQAILPLSIYICGGKGFEKNVKLMLKEICQQSMSLPDGFWEDSLLKIVKVDQW